MAFKIAEAFVRLFVDRTELKKGLGDSKKDVEEFSKSAKEFAHELGSELARIIIPAGLAVAIVEAGKAAIEGAAGMKELATETGFTVEQLSRLEYAAARPAEEFAGAIRTFNQKIVEAVQHGGQAEATFRSVGVSGQFLREHIGDANAVLLKVADGFAKTADGAGKVTVATDLFGARTGTMLIPTLDKGSDGLKKLGDEADRLGRTMSGSTAEQAERFIETINRMKQVMEGKIASPLLNVIAGIAKAFTGIAYAADQVTIALIRDGQLLRDGVTLNFGEMKKDVKEYVDSHDDLRKQFEEDMKAWDATGEAAQESGDKQKNAVNPIIYALEQANQQLALSNLQLREQIALTQHSGTAAEQLAREYDRKAAALLLIQKLNPALVAEKVALEQQLRATIALNAAEDQGRQLREQFLSDEISMRGLILGIVLRSEDAERQAAEDSYQLKKVQLMNQFIAQTQQARDTIKNEEGLTLRLKEIHDNYSNLSAANEALRIDRLIQLDEKYGASVSAIFRKLQREQATWGEDLAQTIEQIRSAVESNLGDALFAGITGNLNALKNAFKSLLNSILQEITHLMAQQVVKMFLNYIIGRFAPTGGASVTTSGEYSGFPTSGGGPTHFSSPTISGARLAPIPSIPSIPSGGGGGGGSLIVHVEMAPGLTANIISAASAAGYARVSGDLQYGELGRHVVRIARQA
jgi:hypothetical protein